MSTPTVSANFQIFVAINAPRPHHAGLGHPASDAFPEVIATDYPDPDTCTTHLVCATNSYTEAFDPGPATRRLPQHLLRPRHPLPRHQLQPRGLNHAGTTSHLYLHCGASEIAFDDLAMIVPPEPTDSWHPIHLHLRHRHPRLHLPARRSHHQPDPRHQARPHRSRQALRTHRVRAPTHHTPTLGTVGFGFRGSWDKSFAQSGMLSFRTFICDNMAMSGGDAISFHRRNTPGLAESYESTIASAMIDFISQANRFVTVLNDFDATPLPDTREFIDTTACALADCGAVLWQNVPHLRRGLTNPAGPGSLFPSRSAGLAGARPPGHHRS
jgi:hypothetical protein